MRLTVIPYSKTFIERIRQTPVKLYSHKILRSKPLDSLIEQDFSPTMKKMNVA